VKCVKLIKFELIIDNVDGMSIEEVVEWINLGMQNYCEFDYCEVEDKRINEEFFIFELRVMTEDVLSTKKSNNQILQALTNYCDFDDVKLALLEEHTGIWVDDEYQIAHSN
jgi:hypothetical protein